MSAVAPFSEISHICLTAVARACNESVFVRRYRIERQHPQSRGNVCQCGGIESILASECRYHCISRTAEVYRPSFNAVLLGNRDRVVGILSVIAGGRARQYDTACVRACGFAKDSYKRGIFSSAVAVDYTFCSGAFYEFSYEVGPVFKFFGVIAHILPRFRIKICGHRSSISP